MMNNAPLTIGIIAGEVSGDVLGGDFMQKMNALHPNIRWVGVGGVAMTAQGLSSVIDMGRLSVMGIGEVIKHLPDLLSAKKEILSVFSQHKIDLFVGIDAPDFNLRIGQALKNTTHAPFCVQYVSPSVWAWRENRIHTIKKATDLVLCLFPFELPVYARHQHPAVCVGHPLLHKLSADVRKHDEIFGEFLKRFHLNHFYTSSAHARPICVMAGSRISEIQAILPLLIDSMTILDQDGEFGFILPVVSADHANMVKAMIAQHAPHLLQKCHIIHGSNQHGLSVSQHAMNACELILLASGTATLEALLLHRPMVVVYKVNAFTYAIAKHLVKIPYVSLPNILSYNQTGKPIVPELIQQNATAQSVAHHAKNILSDLPTTQKQLAHTTATLRQASHTSPAQAVLTHFFQAQTVL
ncbi:lipid-A-disaccharide synthase [Moraxella sp. VT-16-12]|nr:lipid-A-disaccharide synthase [Moraxella sp. VT-16-12]